MRQPHHTVPHLPPSSGDPKPNPSHNSNHSPNPHHSPLNLHPSHSPQPQTLTPTPTRCNNCLQCLACLFELAACLTGDDGVGDAACAIRCVADAS